MLATCSYWSKQNTIVFMGTERAFHGSGNCRIQCRSANSISFGSWLALKKIWCFGTKLVLQFHLGMFNDLVESIGFLYG